jgi:hypothetical protein
LLIFYTALSPELDIGGKESQSFGEIWFRGSVMGSAGKQSEKITSDMFEDMPVLRRKWQAGLRPGETLPHYEDVMLGSLGRLADHIVLLKTDNDGFAVSRTGRYAQKWLGDERWDIPMTALPPDCATVLSQAASNAAKNGQPYLAAAHCVRDGMVQTYDILALPTLSRWGGMLIGAYVNERGAQYNRSTPSSPPPMTA